MSVKINKNGKEYDLGFMPEHYPADRVYLDGDTSKTVQDAVVRMSGEYSFTATSTGLSVNISNIPNIPNGATLIGAILIQKTSAGTNGYAILNLSSNTVSAINLTTDKDYGLRVLYYKV